MTMLRGKSQCAWSDEEFLAGWDQEDLETDIIIDFDDGRVRYANRGAKIAVTCTLVYIATVGIVSTIMYFW
jgi:hypothetical protein